MKKSEDWLELNQTERRKKIVEALLNTLKEDEDKTLEGFTFFIDYGDCMRTLVWGKMDLNMILKELLELKYETECRASI